MAGGLGALLHLEPGINPAGAAAVKLAGKDSHEQRVVPGAVPVDVVPEAAFVPEAKLAVQVDCPGVELVDLRPNPVKARVAEPKLEQEPQRLGPVAASRMLWGRTKMDESVAVGPGSECQARIASRSFGSYSRSITRSP